MQVIACAAHPRVRRWLLLLQRQRPGAAAMRPAPPACRSRSSAGPRSCPACRQGRPCHRRGRSRRPSSLAPAGIHMQPRSAFISGSQAKQWLQACWLNCAAGAGAGGHACCMRSNMRATCHAATKTWTNTARHACPTSKGQVRYVSTHCHTWPPAPNPVWNKGLTMLLTRCMTGSTAPGRCLLPTSSTPGRTAATSSSAETAMAWSLSNSCKVHYRAGDVRRPIALVEVAFSSIKA